MNQKKIFQSAITFFRMSYKNVIQRNTTRVSLDLIKEHIQNDEENHRDSRIKRWRSVPEARVAATEGIKGRVNERVGLDCCPQLPVSISGIPPSLYFSNSISFARTFHCSSSPCQTAGRNLYSNLRRTESHSTFRPSRSRFTLREGQMYART